MKSGFIISGALHVILLLLAVFNLPWLSPDPAKELTVTDVTVMSQSEFDAVQSVEPEISTDLSSITAPSMESNDAARPDDAVAVTQTVQDVTEAPSEQDSEADMSAVTTRVVDPEVAVIEPQVFAPSVPEDSSPTFGVGVDGDAQVASLTPSQPRTAPRVASESALALPNMDTTSDRNVPDTSTDVAPTEETPDEPPSTVENTVTEIEPEATEFPELTAAPPRRSANIASIQAQIEAAEAANAEPEEPVEPETTAADTGEIDDLLSQLDEPSESSAPLALTPVPLNFAQKQSIGSAVGNNWNITRIYGIENYEQFVIRVSVLIDANGNIVGPVEAVEPANPTGSYQLAFEIARVAIQRTNPIPIPSGILSGETRLILKFDPATGVGF